MAPEATAEADRNVVPLDEDTLRVLVQLKDEELSNKYHEVLDSLINTAYDTSISTSHRSVAVYTLCSILRRAKSLSKPHSVAKDTWFRIFAVVLDRSDDVKSKPMRQLLLSLHSSLSALSISEAEEVANVALDLILEIILHLSDHVKVKPALQALSLFLAKGSCTVKLLIERLLPFYNTAVQIATVELHDKVHTLQWFLKVLFDLVRDQHSSIPAGQAACTLVGRSSSINDLVDPDEDAVWVAPLIQSLRLSVEDLQNVRTHLLMNLFENNFADYLKVVKQLGLFQILGHENRTPIRIPGRYQYNDDQLLFMCLEVGKEIGFLLISGGTPGAEVDVVHKHIRLANATICRAIEDTRDSVRLSGLALIVASTSKRNPFSNESLKSLKSNLPHLFFETDANVRGEVLVFVQRLIDRIKVVMGTLHRAVQISNVKKKSVATEGDAATAQRTQARSFQHHKDFLRWFLCFVKTQLYPPAAYQRHITGLRALMMLIKSGLDKRVRSPHLSKQAKGTAEWTYHEHIFESGLTHLLQSLLMDPFDDVRSFAAAVLVMHPDAASVFMSTQGRQYLCGAEAMMLSSGRADHADGVSRAHAILFQVLDSKTATEQLTSASKVKIVLDLVLKLEDTIMLANENMGLAVSRHPMHGILASLRLVIDTPGFYDKVVHEDFSSWMLMHERLAKALHNVWKAVKDVLCNDAPEGYAPEDLEEERNITTKDILSYCWRALKESSSLQRTVVSKATVGDRHSSHLLPLDQFDGLCWLVFTELVELRHRGAFSAVAQAFATCCFCAQALGRHDLLQLLYNKTLSSIRAKGSATTRRSAGLPSLVVGILTACPGTPLFGQAMNDLLLEAQVATTPNAMHGDSLPQVHALNCLRSIFIHTTLGPYTEPYIAPVLSLAGQCLTSTIWAIRNCGLMLFRALIDRLLGSADAQDQSERYTPRFSFSDFPKILEIVLDLLQPDSGRLNSAQNALESVFPALKVIQRIPPPRDQRVGIRNLILRLCQSPHWHVRDMAARTYAGLFLDAEVVETIEVLVSPSGLSQNAMHGNLLCTSYLVKQALKASVEHADRTQKLEHVFAGASRWLYESQSNSFIRALYIDICNTILMARLNSTNQSPLLSNLSQPEWAAEIAIRRTIAEPAKSRHSIALNCLLSQVQKLSHAELDNDDLSADIGDAIWHYLQTMLLHDAHTLCTVLLSVAQSAGKIPLTAAYIITEVLSHAAIEANEAYTLTVCRSLLVDFYKQLDNDDNVFHAPLDPRSLRLSFQSAAFLTPSLVEATIVLWGPLMHVAAHGGSPQCDFLQELSHLIAILSPLIQESQPFDLRIAVARCLLELPVVLKLDGHDRGAESAEIEAKFILITYDLLNDDDDEIRDMASSTATQILCCAVQPQINQDCIPLLASERLVTLLARQYSHISSLRYEVALRMTGKEFNLDIEVAFSVANRQDTSLFAVERQNLFVDPVRETALWSRVLKTVPPHQLSRIEIRALCGYVNSGMQYLSTMLEKEDTGALGLTSRSEAFQFGMRVFGAVDVVATWQRRLDNDTPLDSGLMVRFVHLLQLAQMRKASSLWIMKIENVIAKDIREKLKVGRAGKRVKSAMQKLDFHC